MPACQLGNWESCAITADQAGLGLLLVLLALVLLIARVFLRCWRAASPSISTDPFPSRWRDGRHG